MTFKNSGFYFVALLFLAIAGFWSSYFSKLGDPFSAPASHYTHLHTMTMMFWVAMLISQAFLIRSKKYTLHKIIGTFSYVLVPILAISLVLLAHSQITLHEYGVSYSRMYILFLQLSLLAIFITSYVLAIIYKKSPAHHARFMICTSLTLIDPAVARLPLNLPEIPFSYQVWTFALTDIIFLVLIFLERRQQHGREVFPMMLAVFLFFQALNLNWTRSETWDSFALWFATLPLT
ncbi:hypothetical protein MNBD_GAMMA11-3316 [hydrothermal vent metagenome]|uniref:Uncharacterized protein n=1 Tax=hydrothermal vent metagenome TaxID=652676 RepID=A0A3B0X2M0_9ZZZZ